MAVLRDCSILSFNYNMFDDVLPEEYRGAGQAYVRAMQIWGEYFWQYQLPGCNKICESIFLKFHFKKMSKRKKHESFVKCF